MSDIALNQALYGYERGHRLLRSSVAIDGSVGRLLRGVTDMAFEGVSKKYLTALPLDDIHSYAVIRTWPATQGSRPGSVWSHVLLIDLDDLARLENLTALTALFRNPEDEADSWNQFSSTLTIGEQRTRPADDVVNRGLATKVLAAVYGDENPTAVATPTPEDSEPILLAIWEQQWPRLRSIFGFRTRRRASDGTQNLFTVEVVERLGAGRKDATKAGGRWQELLAEDLQNPDWEFRSRLRSYGSESSHLRDLPLLAQVIHDLDFEPVSPKEILDEISEAFPRPKQMSKLKQALLGAADLQSEEVGGWPTSEAARLRLILQSNSSALDPGELKVESRLGTLWEVHPDEAVNAVAGVSLNELSRNWRDLLVTVTAASAPTEGLSQLAGANPGILERVIRRRPDVLSAPALWGAHGIQRDHLLDLLKEIDQSTRKDVLISLVKSGNLDAATDVCALEPELWWVALSSLGSRLRAARQLMKVADTLRRILEELGPAAVGRPFDVPGSSKGLFLIAAATDLRDGLWRQISTESWVELAEESVDPDRESVEDEWHQLRLRVLTIALASAASSGSASLRKRAWGSSFATLHEALAGGGIDEDAWEILRRVLPRADDWDRCAWLRQGMVKEIRRDRWSSSEVEPVLLRIPQYREEFKQALASSKKKPSDWLRELMNGLFNERG